MLKKLCTVLTLFLGFNVLNLAATPAETPTQHVRYLEDAATQALQTRIVNYQHLDGTKVALVGAIHIADADYYATLNTRFKNYDSVLFEMVGGQRLGPQAALAVEEDEEALSSSASPNEEVSLEPASTETPAIASSSPVSDLNWLQTLYDRMTQLLGLRSQIDLIDYQAENFVHADMSLQEFAMKQQEHNESFLSLFLKSAIGAPQPKPGSKQIGVLQILHAMMQPDGKTELKRYFALSLSEAEATVNSLGTVIIEERNKVAMQVLEDQRSMGKKNLAIFYGSGHMQDFETRLFELGFKKVDAEWLTAWDLTH